MGGEEVAVCGVDDGDDGNKKSPYNKPFEIMIKIDRTANCRLSLVMAFAYFRRCVPVAVDCRQYKILDIN